MHRSATAAGARGTQTHQQQRATVEVHLARLGRAPRYGSAMPSDLHLRHTETFDSSPEHAFDRVLATPLPDIFAHRFWAIPPVDGTRGQAGAWGTVGQTRTIVLGDGGTMREELTDVRRPQRFGYRITEVTGPMKALVSAVDGTWSFDAAGAGCSVTWEWVVHPTRAGGPAMPVFGWMWRGNARQAFTEIGRLLA